MVWHASLVPAPRSSDFSSHSSERTRATVLVVLTSMARSSGGGYSFAAGLTRSLGRCPELKLVLVLPRGHSPEDLLPGAQALPVRPLYGLRRVLRDIALLHRWADRAGADVVMVPHEWGSRVGRNCRLVTVIQNVLYLHPEGRRLHPIKGWLMAGIARQTARFVDESIAVSPTAAELWRRETGLTSTVLAEGIDDAFISAEWTPTPGSVLIMTGPHPHKNPTLAHELAERLLNQGVAQRVTVVGLDSPLPHLRGGQASRVHYLNQVDQVELVSLLEDATVVAVTSAIESFGLPAFEARAVGPRVVVGPDTPMAYWLKLDEGLTVTANWQVEYWIGCVASAMASPPAPRNTSFSWAAIGKEWSDQVLSWGLDQAGERLA